MIEDTDYLSEYERKYLSPHDKKKIKRTLNGKRKRWGPKKPKRNES